MENITNNLPNTISWERLRDEGLRHLQAISGDLWTDYNIHDPGVTLLELLCYAITDLNSRLSQDIADILADNNNKTGKHFFSPREILTVNPVTINDYRKLLIDLPGVKNAWLVPVTESESALYLDKDNNSLLYDYASGSQRISLHGLYRVYIEIDEDVKDDLALQMLRAAILEKLHNHRNLGEDFVEIELMEQETISVFTDIRIDEKADANEVMGDIYYDLKNFISPRVKQYSLKRMLQKGKTIEQIFTGPQLENGFIDDDELGMGQKTKELHTSDLMRIIMAHPEVKDVRNLFISNVTNPDVRQKQEWALQVDSTKALLLESFNGSKIRLFKNETLCPVSANEVAAKVRRLEDENSREIFDDPAKDLNETLAEAVIDLTEYSSIAYKLPAIYGVGETGLPDTASIERRNQAKQLRGYLLFFEQILVNYLKQLDSFKHLFALRQNRNDRNKFLKSYFVDYLPEEIWKEDFKEIESIITNDPTEKLKFCESPFNRKNRILDHLLAQFNEKFADYALFGYQYNIFGNVESGDKDYYYLNAKAGFLENYPELSRNRNRAINYFEGNNVNVKQPTDGLKSLIAAKLGITLETGAGADGLSSEEFFIVEHILLRPEDNSELDFVCSERIPEGYQPDPYSYRLTFVIPAKSGRFGNSKFKELTYTTITNETPAHISYTILEFNTGQMEIFINRYQNFLTELLNRQNGNSDRYNFYRGQLMNLLGMGQPKLPVLHLDAENINGDHSEPANGTPITKWIDLSRNNHHAQAQTNETAPRYVKASEKALPFLSFTEQSILKIDNPLIRDDFTIVAVFKTKVQPGREEQNFLIIAGVETDKPCFTLGFKGNGDIFANMDTDQATIMIESEAESFHIGEFVHNQKAGEIRLYLDGVLQTTRLLSKEITLANNAIVIGMEADFELGEVIVLDSVLTGSRKQKLEEYLSGKWAAPLSAVSSIAKPALHLDANVSPSIVKDEKNDKIGQWIDLSEENTTIAQKDVSSRPEYLMKGIGGLPAVYFHNAALEISNNNRSLFDDEFSMAIVYQADTGPGRLFDGRAILDDNTANSGFLISLNSKGALALQVQSQILQMDATLKEPHIVIISGKKNGDKLDITLWLDGKVYRFKEFNEGDVFNNLPATLIIGCDRSGKSGFTGAIGEIVIFRQALSVWGRQRLEGFLARKWGIDISGVDNAAAPVAHLDAARLASVRDEDGAVLNRNVNVYQWMDLGTGGNHAVQNNNNRRPEYLAEGINGLGTIKFTQEKVNEDDFYDDSLNINQMIQNDFTIMAVFKADAQYYEGKDVPVNRDSQWTDGVAIIDADCSGRYNDFGLSFGKSGANMIVMGGIGDRLTHDNTLKSRELAFGQAHFITFTRAKANGEVKLYADGMFHAQADLRDDVILNDSRTIKIGAFNSEGLPFHGLIGEIVIFNQILSDWQRQRIEEYLSVKWGIPVATLPVNNEGLSLHLDAYSATGITKDEQGRVSQWFYNKDIIAAQEIVECQPVYATAEITGLPVLQFNSSMLKVAPEITEYQDFTLAIVFNAQTTGNLKSGWDEAGMVDHYDIQNNNFGITITRANALRTRIDTKMLDAPITINQPHIGVISRENEKVKLFLDGLVVAQDVCNARIYLEELTIGAIRQFGEEKVSKGYYHGAIGEIILFNRALEEQERQSLEQYLALKWQIDISGINSIAKPVLHLDAGKLATVIRNNANKVSDWLDLNGRNNYASQILSARQPDYLEKACNGFGVLHFDRSCMTLKPLVKDDFSVFIVYRAIRGDSSYDSEYMPVAPDAFTVIAGINTQCSGDIREHLITKGYIDDAGKALSAFKPGLDDFSLDLDLALITPSRIEFENNINFILAAYETAKKLIPEDAFTVIGGVAKNLSQTIWSRLVAESYLNSDGKVLKSIYTPDNNDFGNTIVETAVIDVILADNWLEGAGLFDGNCAGEPGQINKRDFGILVGRDDGGQLIAGIGVPDEKDYQLTRPAAFESWHIAIFTRTKDTGETRLYVDNLEYDQIRIARNISLKDSEQFTIGAVNTGGNYFNGDIAELIVLDKVPDEGQLAIIQSYLAKKWGIIQ